VEEIKQRLREQIKKVRRRQAINDSLLQNSTLNDFLLLLKLLPITCENDLMIDVPL